MYILIILLPFLNVILSLGFGRYLGKKGCMFICTICILASFTISLLIFHEIGLNQTIVSLNLIDFIKIQNIIINIGFLYDSLTSIMLIIITLISFFVHLYSFGYMFHDPFFIRFICYLSLFTFFMIFLVISDNLVTMFIGWEGVGLCSYLLISFWYTRILANKAAIKAMFMNRIADIFLIFSIIIILYTYNITEYVIIFELISLEITLQQNLSLIGLLMNKFVVISLLLLIGAVGKSAQMGLHTWLPDAMEGPTPVSALLHAATMVTAGIFLILRCSYLFNNIDNILLLIVLIGGFTAFFSALISIFQYDIKKIIAYSTCSQLGYMFLSSGFSLHDIAIFHLFNHAFFKALLFLSAGSLIHSLMDEQDLRRMGNLIFIFPITYISIVIGSLAIIGFPFITGFYSKDFLLESLLTRYLIDSIYIYVIVITAAFLTVFYSMRLVLFVFYLDINTYRIITMKQTIKYSYEIFYSLFHLSLLSIIVGFLFNDLFIGSGSYFWNKSLHLIITQICFLEQNFIPPIILNLPIIIIITGGFSCFIIHHYSLHIMVDNKYKLLSSFFNNALCFNTIYNIIFIKIFKIFYENNKFLDKGFIEYLGPYGLYKLLHNINIVNIQKYIINNIFWMFTILILFIIIINILSNNYNMDVNQFIIIFVILLIFEDNVYKNYW